MSSPEFDTGVRIEQELLRLTFCGIVIASFFAAITAGRDLKAFLGPSGPDAASTILGLSAGLAFAYLISVAAALKYQSPRRVDRFPLSAKVSHFFYDTSINIFGIYLLVFGIQWLDGHLLHLPHTVWLLPVYLVLFSVAYLMARIIWALAQRAIEWQYDYINSPRRLDRKSKTPAKP